ncbi:hypothetical protein HYPSUDRAFT_202052 [Hypholoma sublateritium FD-334 SS-4]|uniref:Uncharacterized protein n=1 Tax=Hypholoma sublateritium (strain FD-334 SS-4) TaxID=945553 RepID=A0A0D2MFT5_HYPSF|nr:hypothetical protein HYPSUDRAFT_202052 [Hypholoma sublateritium FD-334 SS-4]
MDSSLGLSFTASSLLCTHPPAPHRLCPRGSKARAVVWHIAPAGSPRGLRMRLPQRYASTAPTHLDSGRTTTRAPAVDSAPQSGAHRVSRPADGAQCACTSCPAQRRAPGRIVRPFERTRLAQSFPSAQRTLGSSSTNVAPRARCSLRAPIRRGRHPMLDAAASKQQRRRFSAPGARADASTRICAQACRRRPLESPRAPEYGRRTRGIERSLRGAGYSPHLCGDTAPTILASSLPSPSVSASELRWAMHGAPRASGVYSR